MMRSLIESKRSAEANLAKWESRWIQNDWWVRYSKRAARRADRRTIKLMLKMT